MNTSELQRIKQRYNIVGNCDELNHALDVALQVAPTDLSVLIVRLRELLWVGIGLLLIKIEKRQNNNC